ncbi:ornithine cyclodeaminase family protein [Pseudorhodoferax sp. Leaf267]|uniref:ornithine cyclodeaminase family protein n=1 Tax=Pseudorhodoferax sp. Leaf267 TaxID=1736316 RepID=UPI0006F615C2|nr:ornithine cyclodeaminase family protein [Pseudorhodoferax sp. Leaf267]KQP15157.1 ornithine cyclodeaminase [Pseudorhodoferax sp. Leaf267]
MPSDARLLLLDGPAVQALLQPDAVLAAVREAFVLHSQAQGRVFPVVREKLHTGGVFGIKSGDVAAQQLLGFKAAGFWPANRTNPDLGAEPHQATIALFDPATGRPLCILDGNAITTARTGAAGGIGLQQLARPGSASVCIFGTGVQARVQLEFALRLLPTLRRVRYVTHSGSADPAFAQRFADRCDIAHAPDADAAVAGSDIVITATPGAGPLFSAAAVRPGTHLNAVGADTQGKRELPEGLLPRARLVVDDRAQARRIGEAQWAPGQPCDEIGDLLTGQPGTARAADAITVFDMTGLALQDLTVARSVHARALAGGLGTSIAWPW